ncbi:hypothetical protein A2313_02280 [Candidatus Roizmanbacteria bacterium RIFOXYB2_FULL_41_10]|uniref:Uncharacterized protein n=1 Tax=Candidatus Roizmanbacteria bacterium RIFOXYA1_FULL_41_12 TaxID=1802082 RepID=A0A1F7KAS9_9BACT|nr:MAG: hypothetical protein A2209_04670 [Candidatus Roizmanbacteria bacterium RIFOXYA1_FULL_41_12]OGK66782.1 MAG: hypothetical protein A2377_02655 [Candidatus Roizmanbacteria bacterium RIFOXYB1_FULL_41_27]OGK68843.1 MAG: hypothetical protein A2262_00410 [Candidatus Roizmanbacteria bacterium RIFOXYA2_FULL_41_8]OGK70843.1 MAG: hypothetical protein A2403_02050 [Candidatus Roizmanbacteria bacterium RIFOXYC1_FULL_41_16]OGK71910.1 MAG: hypothetical protein A2313_02280 [Candidatus Roizmanbacteria bac
MTDQRTQQNTLDYLSMQTFVNELVAQRKPNIPNNEIANYKESLISQVLESVNSRLVGLLSQTQQQQLEKLLDSQASQEQISQFFSNSIPDLTAQIAAALSEFKKGYLIDLDKLPDLPPAPVKP